MLYRGQCCPLSRTLAQPLRTIQRAVDRAVAGTTIPTMVIAGVHDKQVPPDRARMVYEDLGAADKMFVDLACSSHNAMWEGNHLLMFAASLDWLTKGAVGEQKSGVLKLGY